MRIVFMGTPDFAVPTLTALVEGGHEVIAAVTQPDKPKGRGKSVLMTPVKETHRLFGQWYLRHQLCEVMKISGYRVGTRRNTSGFLGRQHVACSEYGA